MANIINKNINGTAIETLSYELAHYVGATLYLEQSITESKWTLKLISKDDKILSTVDIDYSAIASQSIASFDLNYAQKTLGLVFRDSTVISCDISELIDNIDELYEAIEDETERAIAKETEILNKILSLNLEPVGAHGEYIEIISQTEGQLSARTRQFDTVITASATDRTAPTTKATKIALDIEASARQTADNILQTNINTEETNRKEQDTILQNNINSEALLRKNADELEAKTRSDAIVTERQARIDALAAEKSERTNADISEKNRAESAESNLQSKIEAEKTRAENKESELNTTINAEETRAKSAENTLQININNEEEQRKIAISNLDTELSKKIEAEAAARYKGNILGTEAGSGGPYHLPYYFSADYNSNNAIVTAQTISLDGNKTIKPYYLEIPAATVEKAGLMPASDAVNLRETIPTNIQTLNDNLSNEATTREQADHNLSERIDNLSAKGRFLAVWNATTGLPETRPTVPSTAEYPYTYEYKTGDYYIIGIVGKSNKKPSGNSITKESVEAEWIIPSTAETEQIKANDYYLFDGTNWNVLIATTKTYTFAEIAGSPDENTELKKSLDELRNGKILDNAEFKTRAGVFDTFRLPYFFTTDYTNNSAVIHAQTITLDGTGTVDKDSYYITVTAADENKAGLMSVEDATNVRTILPTAISTEKDRAISQETALQNSISNLSTDLNEKIEILTTDLATETARAVEAENNLENEIGTKQDKLTAGTNITLDSNIISAIDTTYTAGPGISITGENNIISLTSEKIEDKGTAGKFRLWIGNNTDYIAITEKPDDVLFFVLAD